jgi:hypothetical protein
VRPKQVIYWLNFVIRRRRRKHLLKNSLGVYIAYKIFVFYLHVAMLRGRPLIILANEQVWSPYKWLPGGSYDAVAKTFCAHVWHKEFRLLKTVKTSSYKIQSNRQVDLSGAVTRIVTCCDSRTNQRHLIFLFSCCALSLDFLNLNKNCW